MTFVCNEPEVSTRYTLEAGESLSTGKHAKAGKVRTLPQGFAMKLGVIPCFMPMLLVRYLNKMALSAMRCAIVYARAVSYTPGPVSVSVPLPIQKVRCISTVKLTMSLEWHLELERFVEYVMEINVVELRPKKRITVHYQSVSTSHREVQRTAYCRGSMAVSSHIPSPSVYEASLGTGVRVRICLTVYCWDLPLNWKY